MRRGTLLFFASLVAGVGLVASSACDSSSEGGGAQGIHPQPQPNDSPVKITSPCTAQTCGDVPTAIAAPHCRPDPDLCTWVEEDQSVSYRECQASECGSPPTADVCPLGTTFKGNQCGSENEEACAWSTACVPPRSTIPCGDPNGCGGKPEIGVICSDGGIGDLECMKLRSSCGWQRTCD